MASSTALSGVNCLAALHSATASSSATSAVSCRCALPRTANGVSHNNKLRGSVGLRQSSFVADQTSKAFAVGVAKARGGALHTACKIEEGQKAPDFTLKDQNNRDISLSRFRGKPVVLYFYPKDDTPGCTKQACYFRDSYEVYKKAGADVVGISSDSPESHKAFADKHNLPFTLLTDKDGALRKQFGIGNDFLGALPGRQTYLLDGQGTVKLVYNNQFMPEKHVSETLRVIEKIKPEETEIRDLPKMGLAMIGKIFKSSEQNEQEEKKDDALEKIGKIFKNPEQIEKGKKETEDNLSVIGKIFKNPEQIRKGQKGDGA